MLSMLLVMTKIAFYPVLSRSSVMFGVNSYTHPIFTYFLEYSNRLNVQSIESGIQACYYDLHAS